MYLKFARVSLSSCPAFIFDLSIHLKFIKPSKHPLIQLRDFLYLLLSMSVCLFTTLEVSACVPVNVRASFQRVCFSGVWRWRP